MNAIERAGEGIGAGNIFPAGQGIAGSAFPTVAATGS
jgi:hypothetical protein